VDFFRLQCRKKEFTTKTQRAQRKHKEKRVKEEEEAAGHGLAIPLLLLSLFFVLSLCFLCAFFVLFVSLW
jgi:hypothetical protein